MAYFGKVFTFDREENYDEFITAIGVSDEEAKKLAAWKPNQKIEKDGDTYRIVYIRPDGDKVNDFKNGVTFDEEVEPGVTAKTTYTVNGDSVTQFQDFGAEGSMTVKRDYSPDGLKVTITTDKWDGAAYRYYTPV